MALDGGFRGGGDMADLDVPVIRLHVRHIRSARICMNGARAWFEQRGWSWSAFVAEGRPIQDFIDTGCSLAARAVAEAEQEAQDGRLQ